MTSLPPLYLAPIFPPPDFVCKFVLVLLPKNKEITSTPNCRGTKLAAAVNGVVDG